MRIGLATWECAPKHTGGLGKHVEGLVKSLSKLGHEVFMLIPDKNAPDSVEGVNIVRIKSKKKGFTWIKEVNEAMAREALKLDLDVFHAQDWITFQSAIELKTSGKFPVVCSIHSTEHDRAGRVVKEKSYALELEENGLKAVDGIVTVSNFMKDQLVKLFGVEESKVNVIPNGVYPSEFQKSGGGSDIVFVGRFTEQKGVEYLLYALKDSSCRIVLAGDGHLKESLKIFVDNLGMSERVVFAGFLDVNGLNQVFSTAKALVMPSMREPFGIVALEGACARVPLILSKTAGVSVFFTHDKNALLVDPTNPSEIVDSIKRLDDKVFRDELVSNGFELVNSGVFSWDSVAEKTLGFYKSLKGK